MKNKRGFTLVELLAVVTLLAAIILVSVPSIINVLRKSEEKDYKEFESAIKRAAELYVERNRDLYPELNNVGGTVNISTNTLITEEYLKQDLENPNDNTPVTNYYVKIDVGNDQILTYTVKGE